MPLQKLYTFEEVKKYLGVGRDTMFNLLHSRKLKGCKIGGKWIIREQDLNKYLDDKVENMSPDELRPDTVRKPLFSTG